MRLITGRPGRGALLGVLIFFPFITRSQVLGTNTLTFDEFQLTGDPVLISGGYGGLQWINFGAYNGALRPATEGYHTGLISSNNVAFNEYGDPASISSANLFDLDSAYLTAAFVEGLQVEVQGFNATGLAYDNTYTLSTTGPNLVHFNYSGVTRVEFIPTPDSQFAMDNLTIAPSPVTNTLTFDEFPLTVDSVTITNGYGGLQWENFGAYNGALRPVTEGYRTGLISSNNVAFNEFGDPASISSANLFDLDSAYLTAAFVDGLQVEVQGFNATGLAYDNTYTLSTTGPNLVHFNYSGVTRVEFITTPGSSFVMDNLTVAHPPPRSVVDIGTIGVSSVGHVFNKPGGPLGLPPRPGSVWDMLIDQSGNSGGGGMLPPVSVDWDTNTQFTLTVAAPAGQMFLVQPPAGQPVAFDGFLWWQSSGGGESPVGPVTVSFGGLQGAPPDFSGSSATLSDSDGYFGVFNLVSTSFTNALAFTSMTITGTVVPQLTGLGTLDFVPHPDSTLLIYYRTSQTNDPGPFVSLVPVTQPASQFIVNPPALQIVAQPNGDVTITFAGGVLQSAGDPSSTFSDVPGNPSRTFTVPKASLGARQFFRVRSN